MSLFDPDMVSATNTTATIVIPIADPEPVGLEVVRVCEFKRKGCGECGKAKTHKSHSAAARDAGTGHKFARRLGCDHCGLPMNAPEHLGAPESFNLFASGSWEAYQGAKQRWHRVLEPLLAASGLPSGLGRIVVEGECSFGDERKRDAGNHRVVIEKAMGDVLVELGYLEDDSWDRYEFGSLSRVEDPDGANRIRLTLFPSWGT